MAFDGPYRHPGNRDENAYTYNGKEYSEEGDVKLLAFEYRWYNPIIGRFTGADPIADKFSNLSPYNYAGNSPVTYIDLWGLQPTRFELNSSDPNLKNATKEQKDAFYEGFAQAGATAALAISPIDEVAAGGFLLSKIPVLKKAAKAVKALFKGKKKAAVDSGKTGKNASKYEDTTKSSRGKRSTTNKQTDVTKEEFEKNLQESGYEKSVSKDGKATTFSKDGKSYTTRDAKDGTPTADFKKGPDSKKADIKIRLKKK